MVTMISRRTFLYPLRTIIIRHKSNSTAKPTSAEYCINLVKSHDYENFICTILLENKARSCAFAIRSFNVEVAKVAEQVTQKDIGLMRMKFWEDTLDKCFSREFSDIPHHPVAKELFKVVSSTRLSKRHFSNLINTRNNLFNVNGFNNLDEMEKYVNNSVSSVYYLILEGCDIRDIHADHAASHLGKAQGIVQLLRSIPHAQKLKFVPIPQDVLSKNHVSHEDLIRAKSSQQLGDCVYEVASRAHHHLNLARQLSDKIPKKACGVFLPGVAVRSFLDRLQQADYDIFHKNLQQRRWSLLPRLWWANFKRKY